MSSRTSSLPSRRPAWSKWKSTSGGAPGWCPATQSPPAPAATRNGVTGIASRRRTRPVAASTSITLALAGDRHPQGAAMGRDAHRATADPRLDAVGPQAVGVEPREPPALGADDPDVSIGDRDAARPEADPLDRLADPRACGSASRAAAGVGDCAARSISPPPSPRVVRTAASPPQRPARAARPPRRVAATGRRLGATRAVEIVCEPSSSSAPAPPRRVTPSCSGPASVPDGPVPRGRGRPPTAAGHRAASPARAGPPRRARRDVPAEAPTAAAAGRRDGPRAWPRRCRGRTAPRRSA